jgi:hypothetical protein
MAAMTGLVPLVAVLLLAGTSSVAAGDLYQWKDAKGVTHYADAPPPKGAFKARNVAVGDGQVPPAAAVPTAAPPVGSECALARTNLERLQAGGAIGLDADRDGKPDAVMSAADQATQKELAERQIHAFCNAKAAATGT